jgi:hypothetical protein
VSVEDDVAFVFGFSGAADDVLLAALAPLDGETRGEAWTVAAAEVAGVAASAFTTAGAVGSAASSLCTAARGVVARANCGVVSDGGVSADTGRTTAAPP